MTEKVDFLYNKLDCLVITKIPACVTNAHAYYCKIREKIM